MCGGEWEGACGRCRKSQGWNDFRTYDIRPGTIVTSQLLDALESGDKQCLIRLYRL